MRILYIKNGIKDVYVAKTVWGDFSSFGKSGENTKSTENINNMINKSYTVKIASF